MRQAWRWFGPDDTVSVDSVRQAGAEEIVTALHHVPTGEAWSTEEISRRQSEVGLTRDGEGPGLEWTVVESLPVSEDIKRQCGDWRRHVENYKDSLRNLADKGIFVVCYNFMPVLDWTRTDLCWRLPSGGTCMRFDIADFAVFDLHVLRRYGAEADYPDEVRLEAERRHAGMGEDEILALVRNVVFGLPGSAERLTLEDVKGHLERYEGVDAEALTRNLIAFLEEVVPVAERCGVRMCCHPDDPPFPLLGLPRVMSTEAHYRAVTEAVDSPSNGITLCSGSLGARPDNDLPGMMERLGGKVHFLHLRNVVRETAGIGGSFHESEHLGGDTDMVALVGAVLEEEARRRAAGREDSQIPFRPDHGQDILDDLKRKSQPGYPLVGRLKGLAELRGVIAALEWRHGT